MKQNESSLRRQSYLPPYAEIIQIESQTVLCASGVVTGMKGNTTEGVGISDFGW